MVDSSDGVNWSQMQQFVTAMLASFDISQDRAHVGFVVFGDSAAVSFGFNALQGASYTRDSVVQLISKISQLGGSQRRVDLAFDVAYKNLFSDAGGTRMTARKVHPITLYLEILLHRRGFANTFDRSPHVSFCAFFLKTRIMKKMFHGATLWSMLRNLHSSGIILGVIFQRYNKDRLDISVNSHFLITTTFKES